MDHKNKVFKNLINFIQGKEKYALLKVNHESYDHSIALAAALVCYFGQEKNILFRTSSVKNIESYLSGALCGFWDGDPGNSKFKKRIKEAAKNRKFSIASMNLFIDTINTRSHFITPQKLHSAIIYPADIFFAQDCIIKKCLSDLQERNTEKIIFCAGNYEESQKELKKLNPVIMNDSEEVIYKKISNPFNNIFKYESLEYSYC